uniref:Hyaluronan-mediated motility receptor C-terminal domain-containing protein n=1 Tax=Graphocephala atropunctata TaxID=36148 RepID=A0A1B6KKT1_9HEMI
MSFPKAKLHRFNEETTCAPPPGRYDPKMETKIKGVALSVSKRFPDQLCTSSSLDSLDRSLSAQPTFRTPQLMRKIKISSKERLDHIRGYWNSASSGSTVGSSKSEDKLPTGTKLQVTRTDYKRLENELTACELKLVEQKTEIKTLKEKLESIKARETELMFKLEENNNQVKGRTKELLEVKNGFVTFTEKINEERKDHQNLIEALHEEIVLLQAKKEDLEAVLAEKKNAIVTINDMYLDLEKELKILQEEKQYYLDEISRMKERNLEIVNGIVSESEKKIEQLEEKLNTKVKTLDKDFDEAHQKVQVDFQSKLNLVSHEIYLETNEMKSKMENCFSSIKDLEKLVCEKEKKILKDIEEANERCKYMYRELGKVEGQKAELVKSDLEKELAIIELTEKGNIFEEDLEHCRAKCKKYEITLNTMQETIKALSERPVESEIEVERLNKVESDLETQKMVLEEKRQLLVSQITGLREGMDRMEKDIINDVTALKEQLVAEAEHYKVEASKEMKILNKIYEKQSAIDMLLNENSHYQNECKRKDTCINDLQDLVKRQKEGIKNLRLECSKREDDFSKILTAQKNLYEILNDKLKKAEQSNETQITVLIGDIEKHKSIAEEKEEVIVSLKNKSVQTAEVIQLLENRILELENTNTKLEKQNEVTINEFHSMLHSSKEKFETEISKLQHDNINKAEQILELSLTIDSLKDETLGYNTKISCLEAEKSSLKLQLGDASSNISDLEKGLDNKNLIINNLTSRLSITEDNFKASSVQIDKLHGTLNKLNGELKLNSNISIELSEAKERTGDLQEKLTKIDAELEKLRPSVELIKENKQLKDELEKTSLKLQIVTEENKRVNHELTESMGHQNIRQKIKHLQQLKQQNFELHEMKCELEVENKILKKKLAVKENKVPLRLQSPKSPKKKDINKTLSSAVLKDRNH